MTKMPHLSVPLSLSLPLLALYLCYDEINGIQDLNICSHADFLILSTSASAQYCGFRRYCIDADKDALFSL